jgi:curved DNA-binding protein CbpA
MDAYRVLGVTPNADEVVIRAAYLALMKRFHPDQPGADPERAKAVAAAYRLLGNPARRAAYDRDEAARTYAGLNGAELPLAPARRTGRSAFFLISAATIALAYVAVTRPLPVPSSSPLKSPRPQTEEARVEEPASDWWQSARDRIAGSLPATSSERKTAAVPEVVLPDLEPQPAPVREPRAAVTEARPAPGPVATPAPPPVRQPTTEERVRTATAAPARRGADSRNQLAALERHQIILYNQSFLAGDERKRAQLLETRAAFLRRLEGCSGDDCRREAYLARNQEVGAIMSN